ncbi:ribulokinase [Alistipes sp. An66]|uniref:ribulokinase n=1 Tax=Alistipes sp. An66 TaxID=1965650 RepID=UPI000B3A5F7F|nr:ribulokinase [Alistipes sp. An66]OUN58458.1 ribulokinase [Alistipes sp. An66]
MQPETTYTIGIDFGSDSVRSLVVDTKDGATVATAVVAYPRWKQGLYCDPRWNQYRQHPLDYLESLEQCIREALQACGPEVAARICGISFDTTASTPVLTDATGTPLSLLPEFAEHPDAMFILWKDHTALAEADEINALSKRWEIDYTRYSGGSYSCEWAWAKMLHALRHAPELREKAYSWVEHCDWMAGLLTGNTRPETMPRSRCVAGHKAMWHEAWGGLPSASFFEAVDPLYNLFRGHLYTQTSTADECVGHLTEEWARRLGLRAGIAIGIGAIDCHFGAVGAGIRPGTLVKVMGTSTCDIAVATYDEIGDKAVRGICGQVDGSVLPGLVGLEAGQSAFGDIYAWFRRMLAWPLQQLCPERSDLEGEILNRLTEEAQKLPVTEEDPVALDWYNGRRTPDLDPRMRGAIEGLTLGTSAPAVFKALVEATAFGSRAINERFREEGVLIDEVIAIGGIARKSPFVMQTMADIAGMKIRVLDSDQACALGAAMFASVVSGVHPDIATAQQVMKPGFSAEYTPDPQRQAIYDKLYARYQSFGQSQKNS